VNRSRRFLFCCERYFPSVGGVQEVLRQVATRIAAAGDDVTVATGVWPGRPRDCVIDGVRVVSFDVSGNTVSGLSGAVAEYQSFLMTGGFDAVLIKAAQQWSFDASVPVLSRVPGRKVFIPCGFSGLEDPRYRDYYERMPGFLAHFDTLIFYSPTCSDYKFAVNHGFRNVGIVSNGADEREFGDLGDRDIRSRMAVPAGELLVLSVGSAIPAKGHWELIESFRRARLSGPATLVINANPPAAGLIGRALRTARRTIGGYPPLPLVAMRASSRGRRVLVTDLPRADVVSLFKAADLFVLASRVEYSPLVLFEAAAAGTPFLSTDVGNSREIAELTGGGRILQARLAGSSRRHRSTFSSALSVEIASVLSESSALAEMSASGRAKFLSGAFQWRTLALAYRSILLGSAPSCPGS
jgi:glycosyltransferase involved in cell wall biosynthesis